MRTRWTGCRRSKGWAARGLSAEQTFKALNFPASPAFHNYGNGAQTLHTIVTEPAKRRLLVGIGGDAAAHSMRICWTSISSCGSTARICRRRSSRGNLASVTKRPGGRERGGSSRSRSALCPWQTFSRSPTCQLRANKRHRATSRLPTKQSEQFQEARSGKRDMPHRARLRYPIFRKRSLHAFRALP